MGSSAREFWSNRVINDRFIDAVEKQKRIETLRNQLRGHGGSCLMRVDPDEIRKYRARVGQLTIALMRLGVAPRWSGLIAWRGELGCLDSADHPNVDSRRLVDAIAPDFEFFDALWLVMVGDPDGRFPAFEPIFDCLESPEYVRMKAVGARVGVLKRRLGLRLDDWQLVGTTGLQADPRAYGYCVDAIWGDENWLRDEWSRQAAQVASGAALKVFAIRCASIGSESKAQFAQGATVWGWMGLGDVSRSSIRRTFNSSGLSVWARSTRRHRAKKKGLGEVSKCTFAR